jgi:hypothetical protein
VYAAIGKSRALVSMSRSSRGGNGALSAVRQEFIRCGLPAGSVALEHVFQASVRVGTSKVPLSACSTQRRSRFAFSPRARGHRRDGHSGLLAGRNGFCPECRTTAPRPQPTVLTASLEVSTCPPIFQLDAYAPIPTSGREGAFASRVV